MTISAYEIALISTGSTIVGALLGTWLGYRLSLQLAAINAKRQASQRLISTFHRELGDLYPALVNWPENIDGFLRSKFTALNCATGEFRHYLPHNEWDSFDKAWFGYYCSTGREIDKQCQDYTHYMPFGSNPKYKENFKDNIDNLLKFAKLT